MWEMCSMSMTDCTRCRSVPGVALRARMRYRGLRLSSSCTDVQYAYLPAHEHSRQQVGADVDDKPTHKPTA
jgi:hypothetical protein